jgi:hypothetical protein
MPIAVPRAAPASFGVLGLVIWLGVIPRMVNAGASGTDVSSIGMSVDADPLAIELAGATVVVGVVGVGIAAGVGPLVVESGGATVVVDAAGGAAGS